MLVGDLISGLSVRAKRDRQNLMKNKPQLDDQVETAISMHHQHTELSAESLPSHKDTVVCSSTLADQQQKNADISVEVQRNTVDNSCTYMLIDGETRDNRVNVSLSNLCLTAETSNTCSDDFLLTDMSTVNSEFKMSDTSVTASDCNHKSYTDMSNQPLPRKTHKDLSTERPLRKSEHSSSLRDSFSDSVKKKIANSCGSKAVVTASDFDLNTARNTTASGEQNVSLGTDRRAASDCVTLDSMIDRSVHQTVAPDAKMFQPNVVKQQQSRVRFEGHYNYCLLLILRLTAVCNVVC